MVSDPQAKTKKSNQINGLTPLNKISNEIKHIASELEVVKQMNDSEHSVVESSDYSSSVVSIVVPSDLHYSSSVVVVTPSDLPSDHLCSVVVCSEVI